MDISTLLAGLPPRISDIPRRWAERTPDAPALREGERIWTYGELAAAIAASALRLRGLGLRPGDRLMVVAENCAAQVALIFAAASLDAWVVAANSRLSAREIDQFHAHSGARIAIYCSGASPEAAAHGARHGAQRETWLFGEWMIGPLNQAAQPEPLPADADADADADANFSAQQPAALIYTSGTTGQSKGVMLSHRNLLFVAAVSSTLRGLTPADRAYGVLPISHVYGLASVMLGTLYAGACLHLQARFSADALLTALREDQLTILQGVPAMYARLLEMLGQPGAEAEAEVVATEHASGAVHAKGPAKGLRQRPGKELGASLRFIYAGGSPLDPVLKRQAEALLGLPLHNGYGMTESAPTISQTRLDAPRSDTSVGYAIPGVATRIVPAPAGKADGGAPGTPAPADIGELWVRGPNVMLGYYKEPALTAAAIDADGWLNTGDVARQDADGALFIVGRSKELIIRAGFNVYPLEVETVLNAHPAVVQSAVVGRAVAGGEEEVLAFVELAPRFADASDALLRQLHAHLAAGLAPYKCPAEIIPMPSLPAAATGKILKSQLRKLAQTKETKL